jgi:hypothetical protein
LRRTLIIGGTVATLAFAAVALGSVKHYRGPIQQGGHLTFDTKVKHHKTKKVKKFFFFKVKLECENSPPPGDPIPISNKSPIEFPIPTMKVKHRRFHGSFYNADFKTKGEVEGELTDHFTKAEGTLRVHGRPITGFGKCDTGTVDWTAEKQ